MRGCGALVPRFDEASGLTMFDALSRERGVLPSRTCMCSFCERVVELVMAILSCALSWTCLYWCLKTLRCYWLAGCLVRFNCSTPHKYHSCSMTLLVARAYEESVPACTCTCGCFGDGTSFQYWKPGTQRLPGKLHVARHPQFSPPRDGI